MHLRRRRTAHTYFFYTKMACINWPRKNSMCYAQQSRSGTKKDTLTLPRIDSQSVFTQLMSHFKESLGILNLILYNRSNSLASQPGIRTPLHKQSECEEKAAGSGSEPKITFVLVLASYVMSGKHTSHAHVWHQESANSINGRRSAPFLLSFFISHRS